MTDESGSDERHVIPERIRELQEGSMEETVRAIREWVDEEADGEAMVLATRDGEFDVMTEEGEVLRYEWSRSGEDIEIAPAGEVDGVVVGRAEMGKYIGEQLRRASRDIVEGDSEDAVRRLNELSGKLRDGGRDWYVEEMTERVESVDAGEWRGVLPGGVDPREAAIREGVNLPSLDGGEGPLIRESVGEIMVDAERLKESVGDLLHDHPEAPDQIREAARAVASRLDRLTDFVEKTEPYLHLASDEASGRFAREAAEALHELSRGYAAISGSIHHERSQGS